VAPGSVYVMETSPDLVNWTPMWTNLNPNGPWRISDNDTNQPSRFYRAITP
jgi:hypothetical protein